MQRPPIIVSPYDAELFSHWWYEGLLFIDYLFRKSCYDQKTYQMTHLAHYLKAEPNQQVCRPSQSSWGYKGFHEYWLNEANAWIYPHLHKATERMIELGGTAVSAIFRLGIYYADGNDGTLCSEKDAIAPDAL